MHRDGVLKNIFKEENWNQVGNAKDFMYTRKQGDKYNIDRNPDQKHEEQKHEEVQKTQESQPQATNSQPQISNADISKLKEEVSKLKAEKDAEVSQIISKINDLITRQNRLETEIEGIKNNLNDLGKQVTLYVKKPEPEMMTVEKKEPHDKPIDRNNVAPKDVTIEKMFNFSNKKF